MKPTVVEVRVIIETEIVDADISAFIDGASLYITSQLGTSGIGDELLKEITKWYTAHMISSTNKERISISEEAGGAKIVYAGKFGELLYSTPYGQMVISLDTTGKMADIGKRRLRMKAL